MNNKFRRKILDKVLKELKGFGIEVELDYKTCEVIAVKNKK